MSRSRCFCPQVVASAQALAVAGVALPLPRGGPRWLPTAGVDGLEPASRKSFGFSIDLSHFYVVLHVFLKAKFKEKLGHQELWIPSS